MIRIIHSDEYYPGSPCSGPCPYGPVLVTGTEDETQRSDGDGQPLHRILFQFSVHSISCEAINDQDALQTLPELCYFP